MEARDLLSEEYRSDSSLALFEVMARSAREAVPSFDAPASEQVILESDLLLRLRSLGYLE